MTISTILCIAGAVALAPVILFIVFFAVCVAGLAVMYILAVLIELCNGKSLRKALS
jgi:hypothetical protein